MPHSICATKPHLIKNSSIIKPHLKDWVSNPDLEVFAKIRKFHYEWLKKIDSPESRIAELPQRLELNKILQELKKILQENSKIGVILIDRLDEGWESDVTGIGVVDGLIYGTGEFRDNLMSSVNALIFLRDNMFRTIQINDSDFSRNIEPRIIRLHWDPQELMYMVTSRIKIAKKIDKESGVKTWNSITANELHGIAGFKTCLQHTLYRPRDIIALLNNSFFQAEKQSREILIQEDINIAAENISRSRLSDLEKEYKSVFPGLNKIISYFNKDNIKTLSNEVQSFFTKATQILDLSNIERQHLTILSNNFDGVSALYSIGFIGLKNKIGRQFTFCHDGSQPNKEILSDTELIVHPCYWPALGNRLISESQATAEEIFDEYEVTIFSATAEERNKIIGQKISEITNIPIGLEGAKNFENWCCEAIKFCFSTQLTNIQLHPNKSSPQRRDIIGTNLGTSAAWKRILEDYKTRQIIFEIKNFQNLSIEEFRQVHGYLTREYGKIAFIICRSKNIELSSSEAAAFREFYRSENSCMIIKLTENWLINSLSKLRSPQKFDFADNALGKIIDEYIRVYANEQLSKKTRGKKQKT